MLLLKDVFHRRCPSRCATPTPSPSFPLPSSFLRSVASRLDRRCCPAGGMSRSGTRLFSRSVDWSVGWMVPTSGGVLAFMDGGPPTRDDFGAWRRRSGAAKRTNTALIVCFRSCVFFFWPDPPLAAEKAAEGTLHCFGVVMALVIILAERESPILVKYCAFLESWLLKGLYIS